MNIKKVLQQRETAILGMEKRLNRSNSLNRTLLEALSRSIGSGDILSYDERKAIKQETKDCLYTIDNELLMQEEEQEPEHVDSIELT
tara:strand:+ start:47 stop:307 length:261 start_codon:yes stop_codon:yes gene_type:complete